MPATAASRSPQDSSRWYSTSAPRSSKQETSSTASTRPSAASATSSRASTVRCGCSRSAGSSSVDMTGWAYVVVPAEGPQLRAGHAVRRPVPRLVRSLVAGVPHVGHPGQAQPVQVAEQVVAELQAGPGHPVAVRSRQVDAGRALQQLGVVDQRPAQVAGGQLDQVQPLPALHPEGVGRREHVVAAVVEVHVQVAAVPAVRGRVEAPPRPVLDLDDLARRRVDVELQPLELAPPGGDDVQRPGRDREVDGAGRCGSRAGGARPTCAARRRRTRPRRCRR